MTLHADALDVLTHWQAPTPEQDALRASYVEHLRAHPDGLTRSCYPDHLTASALVLSPDRTHVLLTLHRKARRWFQLGGHTEAGDSTLAGAALREATEESGLEGLLVQAEPLHLSRHVVELCDPRGGVSHLDVRFLVRPGTEVTPQVSEESLDVRWWPVDALPTQDADVLELVEQGLSR